MTDIFISYARQDRERARNLATALQAVGWSVWWDRDIQVGQSYDQVIEHAIDSAKTVVVLWSKDSISSEWVKNEAASGAERGVLIPALIDDVKPPLEFRRKQTANLIGWEDDASYPGFRALCDGIAATAGSAPALASNGLTGQPKPAFRWDRRWVIAGIAVVAVVLAATAYIVWQGAKRSQAESVLQRSTPPNAAGFGAGTFEFKWPGNDGWAIYRGEEIVSRGFGSGQQALQAGAYMVKPVTNGVFLPFNIVVKPNVVTSVAALGGVLDFKWPGNDAWEIDRGQEKVIVRYGSGQQALQAGAYTVKPVTNGVFLPFNVVVKPNVVTNADAMGGILDFKWPGNDAWEIDRGEEKVVVRYGGGQQALQAGVYTIKPVGSLAFKPFGVRVARGQTVTVP